MEEKNKLECDYCGIPITEKDYQCPNCGADCSKKVKKYKEEKEKKENEIKEKQQQFQDEITNRVMNSFKVTSGVSKVIFAIAFIFIIGTFISFMFMSFKHTSNREERGFSNYSDKEEKTKKVSVGYNELAKVENYSLILDSYELYEYDSENFSEFYHTQDGYQKIAFHFIVEGLSTTTVAFDSYGISLKADDYAVEKAKIKAGTSEYVVSGKESYPELDGSVTEGERLQGYVGFLVPKDKKELKFKIGYITITMDNPAYEGE